MEYILNRMIALGAIKTGEFTLASGKKSDLYIDCRMAILNPSLVFLLAINFEVKINEIASKLKIDSIGSDEGVVASVLLGAILGAGSDHAKNSFVIRKQAKDHGTKQLIEGNVGQYPVLIDDVITSGGSVVRAIEKMPIKPVAVLVMVDRQEGGEDLLKSMDIPLFSLFNRQEILLKLGKQ